MFLFYQQAKLKSHIHDPNAAELVHFQFSSLKVVVEASEKSNTVPSNLSSRAITPLLTHDAIQLLSNCLTSKETNFWNSLGDTWHHGQKYSLNKDTRNNCLVSYVPTFMDGWTPDASFYEPTIENHLENFSSDLFAAFVNTNIAKQQGLSHPFGKRKVTFSDYTVSVGKSSLESMETYIRAN